MEFHRYEYSEFNLTTYYATEHGMTRCHVNCQGDEEKIERSTTRPIPQPINSEEIEKEEIPENVQEEIDSLLDEYDR